MEKGEKLSQTAKDTADEALTKFNELSEQVKDIEQKTARRGGEEPQASHWVSKWLTMSKLSN